MGGKNAMNKCGESEARFLLECFKRGWQVAKPFHHAQGYDFVVRRTGLRLWETVQVKTVYLAYDKRRGRNKPAKTISLRRANEKGDRGSYKDGDFDLLYATDGIDSWLIPWIIMEGYHSNLTIESEKYVPFKINEETCFNF